MAQMLQGSLLPTGLFLTLGRRMSYPLGFLLVLMACGRLPGAAFWYLGKTARTRFLK
jgi:hypothetical protein